MKTMVLVLALFLGDCATLTNTPQQDYVYAMANPCESHGVSIDYVAPDGKTWRGSWHGGAYTWPEFDQCVRDQMQAHPYQEWLKRTGQTER